MGLDMTEGNCVNCRHSLLPKVACAFPGRIAVLAKTTDGVARKGMCGKPSTATSVRAYGAHIVQVTFSGVRECHHPRRGLKNVARPPKRREACVFQIDRKTVVEG